MVWELRERKVSNFNRAGGATLVSPAFQRGEKANKGESALWGRRKTAIQSSRDRTSGRLR